MSNKLTIVIPAYNEEESLKIFFSDVVNHCKANDYQLIIVNDGSSDKTLDVLELYKNESSFDYTIISHKMNRGYGGAIKSGIEACDSDYVVTIDADGQHYLTDIDRLFEKMKETDADLIIGSRKGISSASVFRGVGKHIIRMVAKLLMKLPVYDINSGMKMYHTKLVKQYLRITPVIGVRTAFETVMEIINIIILFNPARIFLPISAFFFFSGVGWGAYFFFQGKGISIGGSTLILTGLIIFLLGLIAEQLSAVRKNQ